jgi:hypothetical protein
LASSTGVKLKRSVSFGASSFFFFSFFGFFGSFPAAISSAILASSFAFFSAATLSFASFIA